MKRRRWLATFSQLSSRGRISPSGLLDRRLHPLDPLLDDLIDGLAFLCLPHFPVAEGLGERRGAGAPQAVDLAAGILDGKGLGIVDAKPAGALLAGLPGR